MLNIKNSFQKIKKRIILSNYNCKFMCYAFRRRVSITYQIDPWSPRIEEKFSNVAIESV